MLDSRPLLGFLAVMLSAPAASAAISVDGYADEAEWAQSAEYVDFRVTRPYTQAVPALRTTARLVATPEGIAVAFDCEQPPSVPRQKRRLERDQAGSADRVSVMIDFDGDGKVAYVFAVRASGSIQDFVITGENQFNRDWSSEWSSAVHDTADRWTVELLIPWTVATMRGTGQPRRTVKVYFDRLVEARGEMYATPSVSPDRGRFVSDFAPLEIAQHRGSLFHVLPYLTSRRDLVQADSELAYGADVFWKPSSGFQLSATLNPDFGQVEADELVVNFDAIETVFSDKRPFFTENQGLFDVRLADQGDDQHQLIYTRRIGGPSDDGSGRGAAIDAALKLNGSAGALAFGVLAAHEADDTGRRFYAARLFRPFGDTVAVGWLGTRTERPALERRADVQAIDLSWRPSPALMLNALALSSFLDQAGARSHGDGGWLRAFWTPSERWQLEARALHFGRGLDFNDLGLQLRPNLDQLVVSGEYGHRVADPDAFVRNTTWRAEAVVRATLDGRRLPSLLRLVQTTDFRAGSTLELRAELETSGIDDLISRGHGEWRQPARQHGFASLRLPASGAWQVTAELAMYQEGLSGRALRGKAIVTWFPRDDLSLQLTVGPRYSADWLVWRAGTAFARHDRRTYAAGINANWFPGRRHEVRLQSQWLAIDARDGRTYELGGRVLRATGEARPDFTVNSFGLQLRYRYELAAESDLYLVYSRGGLAQDERTPRGPGDLLDEALDLRDADQILGKLRYRF